MQCDTISHYVNLKKVIKMKKTSYLGLFLIVFGALSACSTVNQPTNEHKYIPTGSVSQAVTLSGLLATSSESQPILMEINGSTQLPNSNTTSSLDGCLVNGIARASISTERVMISISSMSCVTENLTFDKKVNGYVAGEDAKAGIKGNLIITEGAILDHATNNQNNQKSQPVINLLPGRKVSIIFESGFWK